MGRPYISMSRTKTYLQWHLYTVLTAGQDCDNSTGSAIGTELLQSLLKLLFDDGVVAIIVQSCYSIS